MEQALFEQFKVKRESWIQCFSSSDFNSIMNQIYRMVWNASVFRIINESRRIAPANTKGQTEMNGMLHQFIDDCFFESQFLAIRRLTDEYYTLEHPAKGIFSLQALLKDMKEKVSLLTREHYFAAEGLEYDYDLIQKKQLQYGLEQSKKGVAFWVPHELDSDRVKQRHEQFDFLCGVSTAQRRPADAIRVEVLDYLMKKLKDKSEDVNLWVNKYIAHAATPVSRESAKADEVSLTLSHLWETHKVICQVSNFVDLYMLTNSGHGFLPVPQYNQFEFIDKPLVSSEGSEVLSQEWQEFHRETESWGSWGIKEFRQESGL